MNHEEYQEKGIELFLLDAFQRHDIEALCALVPWEGGEIIEENKYSRKTVKN
jgi:hypothetical protein